MSKHFIKALAAATFSALVAGAACADVIGTPQRIDFNNDFKSDLLWYNSNTGQVGVWLMNGTTFGPGGADVIHGSTPTGGVPVVAGDMDGNGTADLIWMAPPQYPGNGQSYWITTMDGFTSTGMHFLWEGADWQLIGKGDFNGDGKTDLIWYNPSLGQTGAWTMDAAASPQIVSVGVWNSPGDGYQVKFAADFNGDGKTDLMWVHPDGRVAIQLMDQYTATTTKEVLGPGTGWYPFTVGDFNGDHKADIIWRHTDGSVGIWLMNGVDWIPGMQKSLVGPNNLGWVVDRIGDFDGDGMADIVFRQPDGTYYGWLMNGMNIKQEAMLKRGGDGWFLYSQGDFNNDGKTDLLLRNTDGRYATWLMSGFTVQYGAYVQAGGTGWESVKLP